MFDNANDKTWWWILGIASLLTVGGVIWAASVPNERKPAPTVSYQAPAATPVVAGAPVTPVQTPVIIQTQPVHDSHDGFWSGYMMGHWLGGGSSNNTTTHRTTEVHHVYHAPTPVASPAPAYRPTPTPPPAAPSKPSFVPVSRPVSAIKTPTSSARPMSSPSFRSAPSRSFSSGRR